MRARSHRDRDHARLSLAVPILPEHRHQAAAARAKVETIVAAALDAYHNTGFNEISLLSLSTSDYPWFEELLARMHETFHPLGVKLALPSLRVNEHLRSVAALLSSDRARSDAGARGGPRRHARADPQKDQERRPVRRLPRGIPPRLAARQAVFHVRIARRAGGRSRRHRRDGRDDLADRQGRARALCEGDGQRLELRAQAAHAVPMERHADARILAAGRSNYLLQPARGSAPWRSNAIRSRIR